MDNKARYLLRNAIHEHGTDIIHDPFRLNAILREYAKGQFEEEIWLCVLAATEGIADKLLMHPSNSLKELATALSLQFHRDFGIDKYSAAWTVASWLFAFELKVTPPPAPPPPPSEEAPAKAHARFTDREHEVLVTLEQTTKKLAVLFADICGSTSLYDNIGDDLARHHTAYCIQAMVSVLKPHQGTLIKTIGDEIMCTFPSAELGLNAACAMQKTVKDRMADSKQPLSIRIGFHYGDVICEADDVFGDTVNVAARVAGLAKADQIMTTEAVFFALPAALQTQTRRFKSAFLKGKNEQYDIYWVAWKKEHGPEPEPAPVPVSPHYDSRLATPVILRGIPQSTSYLQILKFVKDALAGGFFSKAGTIEHNSVLVQKCLETGTTEFHAILYIQPDEAAKRVIKQLHRKQLNGHFIAVSEYIERSIYNNRSSPRTKDIIPGGRRVADRRETKKLFRLITIDQLNDFVWPKTKETFDWEKEIE